MRRPGCDTSPKPGAGIHRGPSAVTVLGLLTRRVLKQIIRPLDNAIDRGVAPKARAIYQSLPKARAIYQSLPKARAIYQSLPKARAIYQSLPKARAVYQSLPAARAVYQSAFLNAVTDSTGDAIFIRTLQGRITYANSQAERMFGWQQDEFVGQSLQAIRQHPGDDAAADTSLSLMTAAGRATWREEALFFRRDGTPVMAECYHARVSIDLETDGIISTLRDITERRRAETALQNNEARLADLLGTLGLAKILVCDPDDTIRFWSHGCASLYGWSAAEAIGQRPSMLLRTVAPSDEIEAALLRDGEWSGDLTQTCRDGSCIVVAVRKVLQRDAYGAPRAIVESSVDVTVTRQAQAGVHQLNRDLEQRVSQEVASRDAAQERAAHAERMQALGQLAGGIAHDFNNILQVVAGSAALIQRRQGDPVAINRFVQRIIDTANRGAAITRRMLVFARRGKLEAEPAEPAVMLEGLREICACTLGPGIDVVVDCTPDVPPMLADKGQLETALVNLATNARDAMASGGTLTLRAATETVMPGASHPAGLNPGAYVRLSVADTGSGMDAAVLARVVEPFFTTKGIGEGTGLGLSMVKGFAEQSGGGFAVTSEPGIGTVASLWLPRADNAEPGGIEAGGRDLATATGVRVLLVDDDHLVRETLAAQLEAEGHFVLSASGGHDALVLLETPAAVDILVTDHAMPGMNGLPLIQRAQRLRPRLPAILLTGYNEDTAALGLGEPSHGPFLLMHKPVSGAQLAGGIASVLPQASPTGNQQPSVTRFAMTLGA